MYRNKKLLEACREMPCQHCGSEDGTVVAAHSNQLRDGKGRGIKAHDYRVAALSSKVSSGKRSAIKKIIAAKKMATEIVP
jgi:hypothetical protein